MVFVFHVTELINTGKKSSKDSVIFVNKEELDALYEKPNAERVPTTALLPDGDIDWECPCLQGMAQGPCGIQFKAAFSCFVKSKAEPRASDCVEQFYKMQECLTKHPDIYGEPPSSSGASTQPSNQS